MNYDNLRAYSAACTIARATTARPSPRPGNTASSRGPNDHRAPRQLARQDASRITAGGFVQDSWSIIDKVTLNLGVRYDAQFLYGTTASASSSLPNQWSPRVGVIYDPTQEGRAKIFANYARFYESVPLDIADRSLSRRGRSSASTRYEPRSAGNDRVQRAPGLVPRRRQPPSTRPTPPTQPASTPPSAAGPTPIDPDIKPQSSDEIVLGGEYEIIRDSAHRASATRSAG